VIENYLNKIILGDGVKTLIDIPCESVDLIVVDPPYFGAKEEFHSRLMECLDDYLYWYEEWVCEAKRVLKRTGSMYVFIPPLEFAEIHLLIRRHFCQKQIISWVKPNVMIRQPTMRNYCPKVEFVGFYAKDSKDYTWNSLVKKLGLQRACNFDVRATIYSYMNEGVSHPTQKPLSLCAKFIYASSNEGEIVLDPFVGSGTTCVAAKALGRKFIGIEIKPKYYKLANSRIGNVTCEDIFEDKPANALF